LRASESTADDSRQVYAAFLSTPQGTLLRLLLEAALQPGDPVALTSHS
jgi:inactivated superfamily I helicase